MIGFICVHWVSSGSTAEAAIDGVRPAGRRVHPVTLVSLGCALGFIQGRWVHWGAPWGWLGSARVAEFIRVCQLDRRFHPGS